MTLKNASVPEPFQPEPAFECYECGAEWARVSDESPDGHCPACEAGAVSIAPGATVYDVGYQSTFRAASSAYYEVTVDDGTERLLQLQLSKTDGVLRVEALRLHELVLEPSDSRWHEETVPASLLVEIADELEQMIVIPLSEQ